MHKTTIIYQFGLFCHQLTTISPSILNHFWWELYHVVGSKIMGLQCHVSQTTIPIALGRAYICPTLMGACQVQDLLPDLDIIGEIVIHVITMWGMSNQFFNLAGPCSGCCWIGDDGHRVTDNVGKGNLRCLSQASVQQLINGFKGMSPILIIDLRRFHIFMAFLPSLVSSDRSDSCQSDVSGNGCTRHMFSVTKEVTHQLEVHFCVSRNEKPRVLNPFRVQIHIQIHAERVHKSNCDGRPSGHRP